MDQLIAGIPASVESWTFQAVRTLVLDHAFETSLFDFKEVLTPQDIKARESLRATACAMANSEGGYIIFGVLDQARAEGLARIVGLRNEGKDMRKEVSDQFQHIYPYLAFDATPRLIPVEHDPKKGVYVVQIPKSLRRPHMVERTGVFFRRGEGSNTPMGWSEVREQMISTEERMRRVRLFRLHLATFRQIGRSLNRDHTKMGVFDSSDRFDTAAFSTLLADVCPMLPEDGSLLQRLLDISIEANRINVTFDRAITLNRKDGITGMGIQNRATNIERYCDECEVALAAALGPLLDAHYVMQP